jgi:hypothetical protein
MKIFITIISLYHKIRRAREGVPVCRRRRLSSRHWPRRATRFILSRPALIDVLFVIVGWFDL